MKIKLFFFLSLLCPLLGLGQANTIKSAEVTFDFPAKDVNGRISGFSSESTIDFENPENSKFKGYVLVKTIKTGIFLRDWSLKGGKYFDEDLFPKISFESTNIATTSSGFDVTGMLKIKNIEKAITFKFVKNGNELIGTASLYSSDFDIKVMKKSKEENKVNVKMVLQID